MRLVLLLASLPALALAQTNTGLTLQINGQSSQTVSAADCGNSSLLTWTVNLAGIPCSNLELWASRNACGDAPDAGDLTIAQIAAATWSSQTAGTEKVAIADLPFAADGGTCGAAVEETFNLCGSLKLASVDCGFEQTTVHSSPAVTLVYDAVAPDAPTITAVDSLDSALRVGIGVPDGADIIFVQFRQQGAVDFQEAAHLSNQQTGTTIEGLTNGVTYEVRAFAQDSAGNQSAFSGVASGTPVATEGFWSAYKKDGGADTGGCTAAGGGLFGGVLLLLGLVWRKR